MSSRYDTDTAITPTGEGTFDVRIDGGWWIQRGPNGGYVAALLARAIGQYVGEGDKHARSLTVHYQAPATEGPAQISVCTERVGRTVHFTAARLVQGDRLIATASAAHARLNADSPAFADPSFPDYPDPDSIAVPQALPVTIPLRERYQYRHVTGRPWDGPSETAETGGWIRLAEPRPYDAAVVAALSDAWYPAVFTRLATPLGVPTVDLTVHIRSVEALARMKPDDWMAVRFRTTVAAEGFLEEDGELWAPDGTLVAHSRQLGLLLAE